MEPFHPVKIATMKISDLRESFFKFLEYQRLVNQVGTCMQNKLLGGKCATHSEALHLPCSMAALFASPFASLLLIGVADCRF